GEQCVDLSGLSLVQLASGHHDEALQYIKEAVEVATRDGDAFSQAAANDNLGFILYKLFDQRPQAIVALESAYRLYSEVGSPLRDQTRELIDHIKAGNPAAKGMTR